MTLRLRDFPQSDPTASNDAGVPVPTRTALDGEHPGGVAGVLAPAFVERPCSWTGSTTSACIAGFTPRPSSERYGRHPRPEVNISPVIGPYAGVRYGTDQAPNCRRW